MNENCFNNSHKLKLTWKRLHVTAVTCNEFDKVMTLPDIDTADKGHAETWTRCRISVFDPRTNSRGRSDSSRQWRQGGNTALHRSSEGTAHYRSV